jgi:hypothetical protein
LKNPLFSSFAKDSAAQNFRKSRRRRDTLREKFPQPRRNAAVKISSVCADRHRPDTSCERNGNATGTARIHARLCCCRSELAGFDLR